MHQLFGVSVQRLCSSDRGLDDKREIGRLGNHLLATLGPSPVVINSYDFYMIVSWS